MFIPPLGYSSAMAVLQGNQDEVEKAIQHQDGKHSPPSTHKPWTLPQVGGAGGFGRPSRQHDHGKCDPLTESPSSSGIDNPQAPRSTKTTAD